MTNEDIRKIAEDKKQKEVSKTGSESWSSSDERSSANEYSVQLKNETLSDEEALKNLYKKRKKKKHKKHGKHKKKKCNDDFSNNEKPPTVTDELMSRVDAILESAVNTDNNKNNSNAKKAESKDSISRSSKKETSKSKERERSRSGTRSRSRSNDKRSVDKSKSKDDRKPRSKSKDHSRLRSKSRSRSRSRRRSKNRSQRSQSRDRRRSRSRDRRISRSKNRQRSRSRDRRRSRSRDRRISRSKDRQRSRSRDRRRSRSRTKSKERKRSHSKSRSKRHSSLRERRHSRSRSRSRNRSHDRSRSRDKSRSKSTDRSKEKKRPRSRSRERNENSKGSPMFKDESKSASSSMWDVKETKNSTDSIFQKGSSLLRSGIEIKYGKAVTESSSHSKEPTASSQTNIETKNEPYGKWEKVPEGKNNDISKYTKLCLEISAKESVFENHVVDHPPSSDEEDESYIHHPFVSKPAPIMPPLGRTSRIPMNPAQAIMAGSMNSITGHAVDVITGPLEKHFPVSSGNDHRECENATGVTADLPVYDEQEQEQEPINVSAVIARRMGAQQILNSNSSDAAAQKVLEECDLKLKGWTERNKKPGKFTGERGVKMDKKQIAGAIETWVRKDFFHNLMPLCGGVGMRMMKSMGWKQGTPLGKSNEGSVAPIVFDVKVGRGGLASNEEQPQGGRGGGGGYGYGNQLPKKKMAPVQNIAGKHPVSALAEICSKKKLGIPGYTCVFENGAAHNKTFLMKCTIQNVDYQPSVASPNKKHAKAQAALTALKILGLDQVG